MAAPTVAEAEIYALYNQHNPRRPTNWRWQRAQRLVARGRVPDDEWDDQATLLAYSTVARPDEVSEPLASAIQIASGDDVTRWETEANILACRSVDAAADQVGLAPDVVDLYESLFFCVLDRIGSRYILDAVIGHRDFLAPTDVRRFWLKTGYTMGPTMLAAVVDDFKSRDLSDYSDIVMSGRRPESELSQAIDLLVRLSCTPQNTEAGFRYATMMASIMSDYALRQSDVQATDDGHTAGMGDLDGVLDEVLDKLPSQAIAEYRARAS